MNLIKFEKPISILEFSALPIKTSCLINVSKLLSGGEN